MRTHDLITQDWVGDDDGERQSRDASRFERVTNDAEVFEKAIDKEHDT